ncbi:MAG: DUF5693 family protein [Clostridiales Family XIII bacterium]|jgi:hypothetical protein|nr:DUF5693 family protein [Clostridiales Family XIII bacterium]
MTEIKKFARLNLIFLLIIAAALVCGIIALVARAQVESQNKVYDIVLDFQETEALAKQAGESVPLWLTRFKDMKINKVGLAEESLKSLMEGDDMPVSAEVMDILTKDADWESDYPEGWINRMKLSGYDAYDLMIRMGSKEAYDFVTQALLARYDNAKILCYPDDDAEKGGYALIDGTPDITLYTPEYKEQNSKGGGFIELIDIVDSKLMYLSLGMLPEKVELIQSVGMEVIPRTASYDTWNGRRYAKAVLADYEKLGVKPSYLIVGGEGVPGFDDGIEVMGAYVDENDIKIGVIEDTTQLQNILQHGVLELTEYRGYDAVRVFSVWNYIQNRYQYYGYEGAKEIENTLFRTVVERNVRVIYYKPIKEIKDFHTYVTDTGEYRELFANLEKRLERHGFSQGDAKAMAPYKVGFAIKLIIGLGCVAAALLLLELILPMPMRTRYKLLGLGSILVCAAFYVMPNTTELIESLANAVIFGCLATVLFTGVAKACHDRAAGASGGAGGAGSLAAGVSGTTGGAAGGAGGTGGLADGATASVLGAPAPKLLRVIGISICAVVGAAIVALIGAALTAAPLSSVNYMLEIDIFRGVKVAQLLPIAFFTLAYMAYFGFGKGKREPGRLEAGDIKELLNTSIKVWMLLVGAVFAAGGMYYILRTGHEVVTASRIEMIFRNDLEELLLARPRTKEFLFAFPAIMLMVYTAFRRLRFWTVAFGFCGVVGVTSVINTFMHLRTPLYLGFVRTGYSVLFGIIIGLVYMLAFHIAYEAYRKLQRRFADA